MASNTAGDVEAFLNSVEEIESIVKGLNTDDEQQLKKAMNRADEFLLSQKSKTSSSKEEKDLPQTTTGFSKTVINTNSGDEGRPPVDNMHCTDQQAFLNALEADAKERAERRKVNEKLAEKLKEKGNQAFKENNFDKAVDLYTQAIEKVRDSHVLYTNRAQAFIKQGNYDEAIKDCEWALKAHPNAIKAYVHMGRCQKMLGRYAEARESFYKVLTIDPKKLLVVKEYLDEVSRFETAMKAEQKAEKLLRSGDSTAQSMAQLFVKVQAPDQIPMFYSGGFRMLAQHMDRNEDNQAQFRIMGGFHLLQGHRALCHCLHTSPQSLSRKERDLLASALDMFNKACINNESNQEQLLTQEEFSSRLLTLLSVEVNDRDLRDAVLTLLFTFSQSHHGCSLLIQHFCVFRLVSGLFNMISAHQFYSLKAAVVLSNLSLEKKFHSSVRDKVEKFIPLFEELLKDAESKSGVVSTCITAMMNLARDPKIRKVLANCRPVWLATEELLVRSSTSPDCDLLISTLGLLSNLTNDVSPALLEFGQRMCVHCRPLLPAHCPSPEQDNLLTVPERVLLVMGHILLHSVPAVEWVSCDPALTQILVTYIKDEDGALMKGGLKCLTALTQFNSEVRIAVVKNEGIPALHKLLLTKGDENVVGNAALCLSHCTQEAGVCALLAETDIVKEALVWARDGKKSAVQQNCAILLAKLATGHTKHYERLKELHGIQILHDCMKHIRS